MTIGQRQHTRRADADGHLTAVLRDALTRFDGHREQEIQPGTLAGFPLTARLHRVLGTLTVTISLHGAPGTSIEIPASELTSDDHTGLVGRLENRIRRLEERRAATVADTEHAHRELDHATAGLDQPFPQNSELTAARERVRGIDAELERIAATVRADDGAHSIERSSGPDADAAESGSRRQHLRQTAADIELEAGQ
jgi:hypothetical protein